MITNTAYPLFPRCPTFGFTASPNFLVKIVTREGGFERRDRKWDQALRTYDSVPLGDKVQADFETLIQFWHAIGGMSQGFNFKDWSDYQSCNFDQDISPLDQPFVHITGSPGGYLLTKLYTYFGLEHFRYILHPKGDTIRVANEVGAEQDASKWVIEEDTGLLTPLPGFVGTPNSWGGEFYVYCRFAAQLNVEISNREIMNVDCSIKEIREKIPS